MNSISKIDWELFKLQKEHLFILMDNEHLTLKDIGVLDGIINMMDALQDDYGPVTEEKDEMHSLYYYPNTITK